MYTNVTDHDTTQQQQQHDATLSVPRMYPPLEMTTINNESDKVPAGTTPTFTSTNQPQPHDHELAAPLLSLSLASSSSGNGSGNESDSEPRSSAAPLLSGSVSIGIRDLSLPSHEVTSSDGEKGVLLSSFHPDTIFEAKHVRDCRLHLWCFFWTLATILCFIGFIGYLIAVGEDAGGRLPTLELFFCCVLVWLKYLEECTNSDVYQYMTHAQEEEELRNKLIRMKSTAPNLSLMIDCYHVGTEQDTRTWSGVVTQRKKNVSTFKMTESRPGSWSDRTDHIWPNVFNDGVTRVEFQKQLVFADLATHQRYEEHKAQLIQTHRWRDAKLAYSDVLEVSEFEPYLLVSSKPLSFFFSPCIYRFFMALYLVWFYRLIFDLVTKKMIVTVRKVITTTESQQQEYLSAASAASAPAAATPQESAPEGFHD